MMTSATVLGIEFAIYRWSQKRRKRKRMFITIYWLLSTFFIVLWMLMLSFNAALKNSETTSLVFILSIFVVVILNIFIYLREMFKVES